MLAIANGIRSLSDFKRKTSELIARLKRAEADLEAALPLGLVERVRKGARLTVIYRSRPAFQIVPVDDQCSAILYPR